MFMQSKAVGTAVALGGALMLFASPALAKTPPATVHCGQTLTHSVRLVNDLTNCPADGLVIGADGITVDLNGHTIDGTVTETTCDRPEVFRTGIGNPGHDGVTVEKGTVQQFDVGVGAGSGTDGMSYGHVHHMTLRDEQFAGVSIGSGAGAPATAGNRIDHNVVSGVACDSGLKLNTGQDNHFNDNRVENVGTGIVICCGEATDGNVAQDNTISGVGDIGILVFSSGAGKVTGNTLRDIGGEGILVNGGTTNELVQDNAIARAQGAGILVEPCCGDEPDLPTAVRVAGNTLTATGDGIWLIDSDRDVVTRNSITGAGTLDGGAAFGVGVLLNGASDTRVSRNAITDSGRGIGPGIVIGLPPEFGPSPRPVTGNLVVRNKVNGQRADGILVAPVAHDTILQRNTAERNAGDGIHVLSPFTTVTRNAADLNAALGIEAVPGVTDGGGNHAHGNGNPAQCTGVACS
jgi:parallel beta-helix repeat protein